MTPASWNAARRRQRRLGESAREIAWAAGDRAADGAGSAIGPGPGNAARRTHAGDSGFTLVTLVVLMGVMAIFLTVAIESVTFQQRREKEEELIFRGTQIVEGIRLYRARAGRFPVTVDELAKAKPRVLRKVWADPMTGKPDWSPVFLGEEGTTVTPTPNPSATPQPTPPGAGGGGSVGTVVGVKSRICADSIKVYNGHTRYCEWKFFYDPNKPMGNTPVIPVPTPKP